MWTLTKKSTGETFSMLPNMQYTVGKQTAHLVLKDKSISGTHAYLTTTKIGAEACFLELKDAGSKNGTFINKNIKSRNAIEKNFAVQLQEGDNVQFGVIENCWSVHYSNFITSSSGLTAQEIRDLERRLGDCGGKHVSTYDKFCNHLTMKEIKITLKFIHALLDQIPIVSPDYWLDILNVARKIKKGPTSACVAYTPDVTDKLLAQQDVNFQERKERRSVFVNKIFVFLSQKHFETYAPIVEKAGGSSRSLKNGVQKQYLLKQNVVVVQYAPSSDSQWSQGTQTINIIADYLNAHSRRLIPEYEIALAVVQSSTENFCNPDYKAVSNMLSNTSTYPLNEFESIIAVNTDTSRERADSGKEILTFDSESIQLNGHLNHIQKVFAADNNNFLIDSENKTEREWIATKQCFQKKSDVASVSELGCTTLQKKASNEITSFCAKMPDISTDEIDIFNFEVNEPQPSLNKKPRFEQQFSQCQSGKKLASRNIVDGYESSLLNNQKFFLEPKNIPKKLNTAEWSICSIKKKNRSSLSVNDEENEPAKEDSDWNESERLRGGFDVKTKTIILNNFDHNISFSNMNSKNSSHSTKKFEKQKLLRWNSSDL